MVGPAHARRRGFTLVELLVVVLILGAVLVLLSRLFLNYFAAAQETRDRLRLQRDMQTVSYWVRKDLSALAVRNRNFDLQSGTLDFAFLAADDPSDSADWNVNTTDDDLDRITYVFGEKKVTRTQDPLGDLDPRTSEFALEALDPEKGDTYSIEILLYDIFDSPVARSDFDVTLGNFDYPEPIRRVEVEIILSKRPSSFFSAARPPIVERARLQHVAFYRRSG